MNQSIDDRTALLLMLAIGRQEIAEGNAIDHDDLFAQLEKEDHEHGACSGGAVAQPMHAKTAAPGDRSVNNKKV